MRTAIASDQHLSADETSYSPALGQQLLDTGDVAQK